MTKCIMFVLKRALKMEDTMLASTALYHQGLSQSRGAKKKKEKEGTDAVSSSELRN